MSAVESVSRRVGITARTGATVITFGVLAIIVLIVAPLSLEAPFLGVALTGSDSVWTIGGAYATVLVLAGALAHGILRLAVTRWPDREPSLRLGVAIAPLVALVCLLVPESVNEYARLFATLTLPAALAVSIGAATAWVGLRTPQRSASSMPSPLSNDPER